jgi:hypothetical protein
MSLRNTNTGCARGLRRGRDEEKRREREGRKFLLNGRVCGREREREQWIDKERQRARCGWMDKNGRAPPCGLARFYGLSVFKKLAPIIYYIIYYRCQIFLKNGTFSFTTNMSVLW